MKVLDILTHGEFDSVIVMRDGKPLEDRMIFTKRTKLNPDAITSIKEAK